MAKWITTLAFVASVAAFAAESESVQALFGDELRAAIQNSKSVETYRLTGDVERDRDAANWKKGPVWEDKRLREVTAVLLSDSSYLFYVVKPCKPRPGVLFRLKSGANDIDVRLCFECGVMELSCEALKFKRNLRFDPSRAIWAHWSKEAFPDDAVIQGLKEKSMPREEAERLEKEALALRRELEERNAKTENVKP